eukprot:TRINITY_DN2434_c0_g1_i2.p1 TRINITY_DN2434_c0_g1~~TRINITY_DN2434_c0_g1_i2.p1  ORF type:complete len:363 (+),score=106.77 TRINITY_DN2434_c0_g1_i2:63-1091(+)
MTSRLWFSMALLAFCFVILAESYTFYGGGSVPPDDDDYYIAVLSDIHIGAGETVYQLAVNAIAAINALITTTDLRFVIITGDLTNSALPEQFQQVRALLDTLVVPYLPVMGNHDVWSYNSTSNWEETNPTGDQLFAQYFKDILTRGNVSAVGGELVYNTQPTFNPDHNNTAWFQNWELTYRGNVLYGLDWSTREHAVRILGYLGSLPGAALHAYPGGTYPWLAKRLSILPNSTTNGNVIFFQHHPYHLQWHIPAWEDGFPPKAQDKIRDVLQYYHPVPQYWGVICGHIHHWYNGTAFGDIWPTFLEWQTSACKREAAFSLVHMKNSQLVSISKNYGKQVPSF